MSGGSVNNIPVDRKLRPQPHSSAVPITSCGVTVFPSEFVVAAAALDPILSAQWEKLTTMPPNRLPRCRHTPERQKHRTGSAETRARKHQYLNNWAGGQDPQFLRDR